jgi:tetratricopeptide (TPR) repeat protein
VQIIKNQIYKKFGIKLIKYLSLLIILFVSITACSTKKNTFSRRLYHNLTAHYNGWWNGNESLEEGAERLRNSLNDDYTKILPVFNYGDKTQAASIFSYMDRAIEKGSMVAQRHSLWFRNREYCKWIDDSYLLIGKANFYKQEYTSSRQSFNFIVSRYYYDKIKNEANLWLAKTFIETGNFQKAETLLSELNGLYEEELTPFLRINIPLVYADMFIKSKQPEKAKPYLEKALLLPINRKTTSRVLFILAQINQLENQYGIAGSYYQKVIKLNTNYRMAFNAKINLAFLYTQHTSAGEDLKKNLIKMLKDSKNKNYLDQIYYALAEIELQDADSLTAISYLRSAVQNSKQNQTQKVLASLKVADLLFQKEKYQTAYAYYDTAIKNIPVSFNDYNQTLNTASVYSELSKNLAVVQYQDSLLKLGQLPEYKLFAIIDSITEAVRNAEQKIRDQELNNQQNIALSNQSRNSGENIGMGLGDGKWYFYNPQAKSMGYTEFISKWGNRTLTDNWRLSNKQAVNRFLADDSPDKSERNLSDSLKTKESNTKSRDFYLQNIPRTHSQIENATNLIAEALFQSAYIYLEDLKQNKNAIRVFEQFTNRIAVHSRQLAVYFQLYQLYAENNDLALKEKYKNLIIDNYPDTDYAKLVQNPDYYRELEKKNSFFTTQYQRAYLAFENKQYLLVLHLANQALYNKEPHALKPNFLYLKAVSMAQTNVIDSLYSNLESLIRLYPNADVIPLAKNILDRRGENLNLESGFVSSTSQMPADELLNDALLLYKLNPNSNHFVLVVLDAEKINVNAIQVRINDFNKKYPKEISHTMVPFDNLDAVILVSGFNNQSIAMDYYRLLIADSYVFPSVLRNDSKTFVISAENYALLTNDRNIDKYVSFFKEKY